jgi:endoglucanase
VFARLRDRFHARGVVPVVALTVVVVVVVGVVIAQRGGSSPRQLTSSPTAPPTVRPAASVPAVQRLTGDASRFDGSTGQWTAAGATLSRVASPTHHGAGALKLSESAAPGGSMTTWSPNGKAVGGDRYVATAYVRAVTAVRGAQARLRFIGADGTVTDTEVGQLLTDSLSNWWELPAVAAISPKGTTGVQLGIAYPAGGTGAEQLVDDATIGQTAGGSTRVVGPLRAVGAQIIQGNGEPLVMRGLERFGLEGGTKNPLPTNAEIGELKLWGANEVRISLGEQKWLATSCHFQRDYPAVVDRVIRWVTSRGMVALLNLQFSSIGPCGPPGLTPMADAPGAITFWQEVASRYQHDPLVAFDLFNEPNVAQSVWLDGGTFTDQGQVVPAAGMQQLYDTVRGTGATNLVVVSGLDFADHPPTELVQGVNIAYGAHAYQCENGPPPTCTTPHPFDAAVPLHHWVAFAKTHPVIVTEFGWPANNDGTYNADVIAEAEAHGWGWSGFAWDGGTGGLFDLVDAQPASDGTTIEPNNSGMPLVAGFARNTLAGSSP